ncbi:hypothetical protein [Calothrix sp. NIES-2098]
MLFITLNLVIPQLMGEFSGDRYQCLSVESGDRKSLILYFP